MNEKHIKDNFSFMMKQIVTNQFAVIDEAYKEETPCTLSIELKFGVSRDNRSVACNIIFKIKSEQSVFLIIEVTCHFEVENESWDKFKESDGRVILSKDFLSFLAMHTVGTTRGILHSKTEGTKYNQFILPPVNVTELIKEDLIVPCK